MINRNVNRAFGDVRQELLVSTTPRKPIVSSAGSRHSRMIPRMEPISTIPPFSGIFMKTCSRLLTLLGCVAGCTLSGCCTTSKSSTACTTNCVATGSTVVLPEYENYSPPPATMKPIPMPETAPPAPETTNPNLDVPPPPPQAKVVPNQRFDFFDSAINQPKN